MLEINLTRVMTHFFQVKFEISVISQWCWEYRYYSCSREKVSWHGDRETIKILKKCYTYHADSFFKQGLRFNSECYVKLLKSMVNLQLNRIASGKPYMWQQDSVRWHSFESVLLYQPPHHLISGLLINSDCSVG